MKRGDLVILANSNTYFDGSYGYDLGKENVWVPNGTVGIYWEDSKVEKGKIGVLVEGRLLWFDQLDSRVIHETG